MPLILSTVKRYPIWVADYVLTGYGTGAIMAVPAHDTRDFEFARNSVCQLPASRILMLTILIREKEYLNGEECWTEDGKYINSSERNTGIDINGLNKEAGIANITDWLECKKLGKAKVNYKLRDWLFSRQRYWGEPFPVIHWEDGEITCLMKMSFLWNFLNSKNIFPGNQANHLFQMQLNG